MYSRGPPPAQLQNRNKPTSTTKCQKCLKTGHHTYECKFKAPYVPRPSRSKQLADGLKSKARDEGPSVEVPEEFKGTGVGGRVGLADMILMEKEKARAAAKAKEDKELAKLKSKSKSKDSGRTKRRDSISSSSGSDSDSHSDSESVDSRSRSPPPRRARRRSTSTGSRSPVRRSASPRR